MADDRQWFAFQPSLKEHAETFAGFAKRLAADGDVRTLRIELTAELGRAKNGELPLQMVQSIALDLAEQGWSFTVDRDRVMCAAPSVADECSASAKQRIRKGHAVERSMYLRQRSVQEFLATMEQRRLTSTGWHSIYSLMRDGRDLAAKLGRARHLSGRHREAALAEAVDPYIQFVEPDRQDTHTGLLLTDIWRYFRLTWVNVHKSVPGRTMLMLIRDRAAEHHPIVGIAALASSVAQLDLRDAWIGWSPRTILARLDESPSAQVAKWLLGSLHDLVSDIYRSDLLKDKIVTRRGIVRPTQQDIDRLRAEAARARKMHHENADAAAMKRRDEGWRGAAQSSLFQAKRCEALSKLLAIRMAFQEVGFTIGTKRSLLSALGHLRSRTAVGQLVRAVKAKHVGIDMMDLTVCGAIAPYNRILGGKLVCTLLTSPEVVQHYRKRYKTHESIIASSMKGSPVRRTPRLVLLCTTSLYGRGSSQYNRVKVPADAAGGKRDEVVEYKHLGLSKGYGSFHFSTDTVRIIDTMLSRRASGKRVNSIFGEGVNPRMRKIREALEFVDLRSDAIMIHGNPRVVYGVALASNFREVLLGREDRPRYYIPQNHAESRTTALAAFWRSRWLSSRINAPEILTDVAAHTLSYPVTHGARVTLPVDGEDTEALW